MYHVFGLVGFFFPSACYSHVLPGRWCIARCKCWCCELSHCCLYFFFFPPNSKQAAADSHIFSSRSVVSIKIRKWWTIFTFVLFFRLLCNDYSKISAYLGLGTWPISVLQALPWGISCGADDNNSTMPMHLLYPGEFAFLLGIKKKCTILTAEIMWVSAEWVLPWNTNAAVEVNTAAYLTQMIASKPFCFPV